MANQRLTCLSENRKQAVADTRGLFCYRAVRELGYTVTHIAEKQHRTGAGVVYALRRGQILAKQQGYNFLQV